MTGVQTCALPIWLIAFLKAMEFSTLTRRVAEQSGIETFTLDVLKQDQIDAAVKRVGTPDILFNCSGYVHAGTIMETDDKAWDFSFDLNVKAMHRGIQAFLPGMVAKGKGAIVNMASGAGPSKAVVLPWAGVFQMWSWTPDDALLPGEGLFIAMPLFHIGGGGWSVAG